MIFFIYTLFSSILSYLSINGARSIKNLLKYSPISFTEIKLSYIYAAQKTGILPSLVHFQIVQLQ